MSKKLITVLSSMTLFAAGMAHGAFVGDLDSSGIFSELNPASTANISGLGTNEVFWGNPYPGPGGDNTGYRFDGVTDQAVVGDGSLFALGDFSHINNPIYLPSIDDATLDVSLSLQATGGGVFETTFPLTINHNETRNRAPCNPAGATVCPDVVTFDEPPEGIIVEIDGELYEFDIIGFSQNGGITLTDEFITEENQVNTATLYANLTFVPLPPAIGLMGLALVSLVTIRRRKQEN